MSEDAEDPKSGTPAKRLTPEEWESVKSKWELGSATLSQMAEEFGVRADTLQRRLKAEGVVKGCRAHEVATAVESEVINQAVIRTRQIEETKRDHYDYAVAIAKMTMGVVVQAKKDKTKLATVDAEIAALNKVAKTLEVLRKERFAILGLDKEDGDPDDNPELVFTVLDEEAIEEIQNQRRSELEADYSDELSDLDGVVDEGFDLDDDDQAAG